jgi:hypothetical protein
LLQRFAALDAFLLQHQPLWRPRPFSELVLGWEAQWPDLAAWLRSRSLADAEGQDMSGAPAPYPQLAPAAAALSAVDKLMDAGLHPAAPRLNVDVPGRKWAQIEAFGQSLSYARQPSHWLDWCAGKGHLGRRLLQPGQHLTCLEHDPALVQAGAALSKRHGMPAEHRQQDVMAADLALDATHTPVALHACGDLHVRLIQRASAAGCQQLAIAPCCYNRTPGAYQPLSTASQQSALHLSNDDLGLPLSETVTAGARVRRQRDQSMARRLAFDLLQRQLRGSDSYLPTPSLPSGWLAKPFFTYIQDLAALKGLSTAGFKDWDALEAAGWLRLAEVRNLEAVRNLFRRPLEIWLVLDRALYLEENGYHVRLGEFCEASLTPRNLMLLAER